MTLTAKKAKTILRDGTINGKPLTARQKRFFGFIAGSSRSAIKKMKKS